ncbi:MAG: hypothetical protein HZB71_06870 [Betaproteobacteria bacterium]|nr:hypothetical protein [Betaproteobacteria bacterium]
MKTAALLCLVLGLIAGPAYWVTAKFFTGERLAMLDLKRVDAAAGVWRSAEFRLEPGMAPAGLVLHVETSRPGGLDENVTLNNHFLVTLSRDGEKAKPLGVSQKAAGAAGPAPTFREHLLYFKEVLPGAYQLEVQSRTAPELPVTALRLEVRQHLHEPESRIVTGGMVLMMVGILTLVAL